MRALMKYDSGKGKIELRDVPVPEIGEDDLLIEVKAAGICGSDIGFVDGENTVGLHPPVVLGHEFAGIVSQVGSGVSTWKPGDRVVSENTGHVCGQCYACSTGDYVLCPDRLGLGYGMDGGFTRFVRIPGDLLRRVPHSLFRIPDCVPFEHAAILDPAANAYRAMVQEGGIIPGEAVAVFGVGALGLFSIQIARIAGASEILAIGLSGDTTRFEAAKKLGANHHAAADCDDISSLAREVTAGEGFGLVIDAAGPPIVLSQSFSILRNGGKVVKIGFDQKPLGFSLDSMISKSISIKGHLGYDWEAWHNCIRLLEKGALSMDCIITHTLGLSDWEKGFALTRSKEAIKVILNPEF